MTHEMEHGERPEQRVARPFKPSVPRRLPLCYDELQEEQAMTVQAKTSKADELIRRLDEATSAPDDATRCRNVKRVLIDVVSSGEQFIPAPYLEPAPDRYARRLLHRDPGGRYTALVLVWD